MEHDSGDQDELANEAHAKANEKERTHPEGLIGGLKIVELGHVSEHDLYARERTADNHYEADHDQPFRPGLRRGDSDKEIFPLLPDLLDPLVVLVSINIVDIIGVLSISIEKDRRVGRGCGCGVSPQGVGGRVGRFLVPGFDHTEADTVTVAKKTRCVEGNAVDARAPRGAEVLDHGSAHRSIDSCVRLADVGIVQT
nr:hypothetical protein [Frankia sp. Cr1]